MLTAKILGRCIFTSKSGFGVVGVVGVESGDVVALVFRASGPLVLGPYKGFYRLIGCAYVLGLMDVDSLDNTSRRVNLREQTFDVR